MPNPPDINWSNNNVVWNNNPFTWNEIALVQELAGSGALDQSQVDKLSKEKKKTLVKLIVKLKGETFKEEKYKPENVKLTVNDVKKVIEEVQVILNSIKSG